MEMKADDKTQANWDDMVFDGRNQDYGAFVLRQAYAERVFRGGAITTAAIALLIFIPWVISLLKGDELPDFMNKTNVVFVTELKPPPAIQKKPAKLIQAPEVKRTDAFVPPKVVTQEVPEPEKPKVEEPKKDDKKDNTEPTEEGSTTGDENGEGAEDNTVYEIVEQLPQFVGGRPACDNFISSNIRYPMSALQRHLTGTVSVSFIVNTDGSLENVKAISGFYKDCDREAERLVRSMPPWEPARNSGKPVRVQFLLKITFKQGTR